MASFDAAIEAQVAVWRFGGALLHHARTVFFADGGRSPCRATLGIQALDDLERFLVGRAAQARIVLVGAGVAEAISESTEPHATIVVGEATGKLALTLRIVRAGARNRCSGRAGVSARGMRRRPRYRRAPPVRYPTPRYMLQWLAGPLLACCQR